MIEYPVKLKFIADKGDLKKAVSVNAGGGAGGAGGNAKSGKQRNTLLGRMGKTLGLLLTAVFGITAILKPILELINILYAAISAVVFAPLSGFFEDIAGGLENISKVLSGEISVQELFANFWANLSELFMNTMKAIFVTPFLETMALIWDILKAGWSLFATIGVWIWENILKPAFGFLADVGMWIWDEILKPAWDWFTGVGEKIWTDILQPAWDWFTGIGEKIWTDILKPAWEWFSGIGEKIWELIKSGFTALKDKLSNFSLGSFFGGGGSDSGDGGGARAFGGTIPQDGLYRMHAGETVSRGNSVGATTNNMSPTININVSGGVDRKTINEISRQMRLELQTFSRL
jgi:phage-related protein